MTITSAVGTNYTLSCTGQGGSTSSNASLKVTQPAAKVLDCDKDGVTDDLDKCANTPTGVTGVTVDTVGCPFDSDRDGVYDYLDKCPDTPSGVKVDTNGCTYPKDKPCESFNLDITFDTNKVDIKPEFTDELQRVADFLKKYSKATAAIDGHTDNVGSAAMNMKLSERRAAAVRAYIVNKFGIAAARITAKGHGLTKPVASNKTAEGRAKNRHIEANLFCGQ